MVLKLTLTVHQIINQTNHYSCCLSWLFVFCYGGSCGRVLRLLDQIHRNDNNTLINTLTLINYDETIIMRLEFQSEFRAETYVHGRLLVIYFSSVQ